MNTTDLINREVLLDATPIMVWEALTNPAKTKQFMFNCEVKCDWKKGSPISWKGNFQGYESAERGVILDTKEAEVLKYTSFDPNFGLEDLPENYLIITYTLEEKEGKTLLSTCIENMNKDPNRMKHVAAGWDNIVLPSLVQLFSPVQL
jgi:uncharacterized protein YndB with AHSA1/START domain